MMILLTVSGYQWPLWLFHEADLHGLARGLGAYKSYTSDIHFAIILHSKPSS
jgi:hypothetical protein